MADFSQKQILTVWEKAQTIPRVNSNQVRKDQLGREIAYEAYGLQSPKGWNIHHITPISKGGSNDISNLQALHWESHNTNLNYPCRI